MYGFVREPKWIAAHLLTLLLLIAFMSAGVWQFQRHQARGDRNEIVVERSSATVLTATDLFASTESIEFRMVQLEGKWSPEDAVLIRNRSHQEMAGCHLAVPLAISDARAVLVVVGWLHQSSCDANQLEPPSETVSLTGRVRLSQERGAIGARDSSSGILASLARTDVARIDQQVPFSLAPVYVEVITSDPWQLVLFHSIRLPLTSGPTWLTPSSGFSFSQWGRSAIRWCCVDTLVKGKLKT